MGCRLIGVIEEQPGTAEPALPLLRLLTLSRSAGEKKADVAEYLWVLDHVGLLVNGRPGRVALYLVIRRLRSTVCRSQVRIRLVSANSIMLWLVPGKARTFPLAVII